MRVPEPKYLDLSSSRSSYASNEPAEAPLGTSAVPLEPSSRKTVVHKVGLPLESKTSSESICLILIFICS